MQRTKEINKVEDSRFAPDFSFDPQQSLLLAGIWKYRLLRIRHCGNPITEAEQRRMNELDQIFAVQSNELDGRHYRRFPAKFNVGIRVNGEGPLQQRSGRGLDISVGGVKAMVPGFMQVGDNAELRISQQFVVTATVTTNAWVAWRNGDCAGFRFVGEPLIELPKSLDL